MFSGVLSGLVNGVEQVVFDYEVTGSAVSSISTGNILNGNEDGWYTIIVRGIGGTGADADSGYIRFNGDAGANYGRKGIRSTNTSVSDLSATGENGLYALSFANNVQAVCVYKVYAKSGSVRLINGTMVWSISGTTVNTIINVGGVWNNTADNITSISLASATANVFGVGTRIIILRSNNFTNGTPCGTITTPYIKGAWVRVGSQVLGSATTAVTFSGLDGDRDVLYYVKASIKSAATNNYLSVSLAGDTGNNYGRQYVQATSTTISAGRALNGAGGNLYLGNVPTSTDKYCHAEMLIFAKSGFVRPSITSSANDITGTTVTTLNVLGQSWSDTSTVINQIVITGDQANGLAAGTQVDCYALRPNG